MSNLNIIIHKSMLEEDELDPPQRPGEYEEALRALKIIRAVENLNPANTLNFEGFDFESLPRLAKGHHNVTLYGCCRESCLEKSAEELVKAGFNVSYHIDGTTS
jgi:hypothetical protein